MKQQTFGKIIEETIAETYYGFVYRIDFKDSSYYIGQKSFRKGTNWRFYKSSSKKVQEKLKTEIGEFVVLKLCRNKSELTYEETRQQFLMNCLEDPKSLCENICGKFFRKRLRTA